MLVIPAIDIREGRCVRLAQGDFAREKVYDEDPVGIAQHFESQGAKALHVVDLDGARAGHPVNSGTIRRIAKHLSIPVQVGGGVRSQKDIDFLFQLGVTRVVIGTKLIEDPEWTELVLTTFRDALIAGIDCRDGKVAIAGWEQQSEVEAVDLALRLQALGARRFILTDIARDGMLTGPNLDLLEEVASKVVMPVVQSGGIGTLDHIRELRGTRAEGVIIGRALYEGKFTLREAIEAADQ